MLLNDIPFLLQNSDLRFAGYGKYGKIGRKEIFYIYLIGYCRGDLSPSILHNVLFSLGYNILIQNIKDNKYSTSNRYPVGYSSCLDYKTSSGYREDDRCYLGCHCSPPTTTISPTQTETCRYKYQVAVGPRDSTSCGTKDGNSVWFGIVYNRHRDRRGRKCRLHGADHAHLPCTRFCLWASQTLS